MFSLEKYKMEGKKFYMQYMFDFLYSYIIRGVFLGNPLVDDSRRGRRWMALAALALSLVVAAGNGLQNYADYGAQYTGLLDPHFLAAVAISFLSSLVLISAALFLLCWCHRRGQHRLERNLEEREPGERERVRRKAWGKWRKQEKKGEPFWLGWRSLCIFRRIISWTRCNLPAAWAGRKQIFRCKTRGELL